MISKFILWHKKVIKRIVIIVILIIMALIACERIYNSSAKFQTIAEDAGYYGILDARFTSKEKLKDFDYLYEFLKENYPFYKVNERINNENWLDNKRDYRRILKNANGDAEYLIAISNILQDLNDKNTYVLTGDTYRRFYMYYYPDLPKALYGFRATARYDFNGDISNIELDPNNNLIYHNGPVLETKILIENELAYLKIKAMAYNHIEEDYPKIKNFLKNVEKYDKIILDIRGNAGGFDEYWQNIVELLINDVHSAKYYSFFKQNSKSTLDDYQVSNIYTIRDLDDNILNGFPDEIRTDFNFYKTNLIEIFSNNDVNFKGNVYLLVDREVYASAEKFAAFAKDTGFATVVGETTGGGMTFEEVPMISMPYGGFLVRYSREMVMNSDGTINMETKTIPHIVVDNPIPDEEFSKDECIQAVIED